MSKRISEKRRHFEITLKVEPDLFSNNMPKSISHLAFGIRRMGPKEDLSFDTSYFDITYGEYSKTACVSHAKEDLSFKDTFL